MSALPEDFGQAIKDSGELLLRGSRQPLTDSIDGQRANLADFDPGSFRQPLGLALERQRKSCARLLARHRHGDDRAGPLVEYIVAQNQNRSATRLFMPARSVEFRPADVAP